MTDPYVISGLTDQTHELRQAILSYEERTERTRQATPFFTSLREEGIARGKP